MILFFCYPAAFCQTVSIPDSNFNTDVGKWFKAWELLSREVYGLKELDDVDFVFFDEDFIYSTSLVSATAGKAIEGPLLMGKKFKWLKKSYMDSIILPNGNKVEAGLLSFASDQKRGKPFFVMPLLNFWQKAGVTSKELGLEHLVTGVFLHEFSHSQQMKNFGRRIAALEKAQHYPSGFSDDIVQQVFGTDSNYASLYRAETQSFYDASSQEEGVELNIKTKAALSLLKQRHDKHFADSFSLYKEIDLLFLTMEGIGQYSMYAWLTHPKGAALDKALVISGVRRGKKQWSQDQGFALFLIMEKLAPVKTWAARMFGNKLSMVTTLINKQID